MRLILWHGTNQEFDTFDPALRGLANANNASRAAYFFARRRDTAEDYARHAAKNLVPDHLAHQARVEDLLARAARAMREQRLEQYEALIIEAEDLEASAMQAEPAGAAVLRCEVRLENPFMIDGADRRVVTNLAAVIERARAQGHDAIVLRDIADTPSGAGEPDDHIAVFDAHQIDILERIEIDPVLTEPILEEAPAF